MQQVQIDPATGEVVEHSQGGVQIDPATGEVMGAPTTAGATAHTAAKPTLWQTMKSNFNKNTQHAPPPTSVLDMFSPKRIQQNVGATFGDFARSIPHLLDKPPAMTLDQRYDQAGKQVEEFAKDPVAAYTNAGAQAAAGAMAGEAVALPLRGVARAVTKRALVPGIENVTGTTPKATAADVAEASGKNAVEVQKANEKNATLAGEHQEKTQKALDETKQREDLYQNELREAKAKGEAELQKKLVEVNEKRAKAEQERKIDLKKHLQSREQAIAARKAAEEKLRTEQAKQGRISPTEQKYRDAQSNLVAKVETAREKALKVGNEKYSAVNETLNPLGGDMEKIGDVYGAASESIGDAGAQPAILTRLGKSIEHGEQLTYKDEQGLYSELGKELSKGTLSGRVYHAYDMLHDALGEDMQRMADSQGMGEQLSAARAYWKRMKQTFGKPLNPRDAATAVVKGAARDLNAEAARANQIRLLGSFDPEIPAQFSHLENIGRGVEALPEPATRGELAAKAKAPAIPARKPILPPVQEIPNPPRPAPAEQSVAQPERAPLPDRPAEVQPQTQTLSPETLQQMKAKRLAESTEKIRNARSPIVNAFAGYGIIKELLRGNLAGAGLDMTARLLYGTAKPIIADMLDNPRVVQELTKFSARDAEAIQRLPPEQRTAFVGDMTQVVDAAKQKGIPIAPALIGILVSSKAPPKRVAAALQPQ